MSESTRPHKKQRTSKNIFVDLEANVADESEEEEEEEEEEDARKEFMTEDPFDRTDEAHAALTRALTMDDEDDEEERGWQMLLEHAQKRTQGHRFPSTEQNDDYHFQETDMLWEIGCKVGSEQTAVLKILKRSLHPTMPEVLTPCAVATSWPGRIYADVRTFAQATRLARLIPDLDPSRVLPVPHEEILGILNVASSRYTCQQWARVSGKKRKWSLYGDDTGLIGTFGTRQKKHLALLPRFEFEEEKQGHSRPLQALLDRRDLEARVGKDTVKDDLHGGYIWKGHIFSAEGLLLVDLDDIDIIPLLDTLPTSFELEVFRSTSLLSAKAAQTTAHMIRQTRLKVGDRVKVVAGEYLGIIGEIREIEDAEVAVYLPSQDITEPMMKNSVRAAYCVGDQVQVLEGENKHLVGWVIEILADKLCILNIEKQLEVNVLKTDVEFHSPMHIASLKPRSEYPKWGKLGGQNPNDVYIGKRVMVIGMHPMKGYKGYIKSTTLDGHAYVQFDSRLDQTIKVILVELACLTSQDVPCSYLLSGRSMVTPPSALRPTSATPLQSGSVGLTPAWDPSSHAQSVLSPAWDPSSRTPLQQDHPPRPVHWLDDPALKCLRLKLKADDDSIRSPCVEFMGVENDHVKVRDMAEYKLVPLDSVTALIPNEKGSLVTPVSGKMQGDIFRVREFTGDRCVVRKPGTRPAKNQQDPTFLTSDLVQVYPPAK